MTVFLSRYAKRMQAAKARNEKDAAALAGCTYGFLACWTMLAQVAGLAGASTFPLAGFLIYTVIWKMFVKKGANV